MPTPIEYRGRHVRGAHRGIDSRTSRGPERWARAAHNALTNPLSKGAKLYFDRVTTARQFLLFEEAASPFEHVEDIYDGQRWDDPVLESTRRYVTCNIVCAAMQIQLDFSTTSAGDVRAVLRGAYRRSYNYRGVTYYARQQTNAIPLDTTTLKRDVRCQVCGTTVKRG